MNASNWLRDDAAATYTGITKSTLAKYRLTGEGPKFARIGKRVAYLQSDLDQWMLARRVQSTAETPWARRPNAGRKRGGAA